MSRVANNLTTSNYTNGFNQPIKSTLNRTGSNASTNKTTNGNFHVRSAAPPPAQKETVHACPLCNSEYKDPRVLPCTHTYCFNCIRDKLIKNSRITCPKCHYQAQPFDEIQLNDLPPNLILSQEWRIGARPMVSMPSIKKPITYQSNVPIPVSQPTVPLTDMSLQQEKSKRAGHEQTSTSENDNRSMSTSSAQPGVSELVKVYSQATTSKMQRNENGLGNNKQNGSSFPKQQQQQQQRRISSSPPNGIQHRQAHEEAYEEITLDGLTHGTTPNTLPLPEQLQNAIENYHYPPEASERPMAISSSRQNSSIGNLCHIVSSIHHESPENSPIRQTSIPNNRPSNVSDDDDVGENHRIVRDTQNHRTPPREQQQQQQHLRQMSNGDSVRSGRSDSTSQRSSASPIKTNQQIKSNLSPPYRQQQEDEKVSHRTSSIVSSSRRSPVSPIRTNIQEKSNLSPPYRQQQEEKISHRTSSIASSSQRSPVSSPIRTNNQEKFNQSPPRHQLQQQQQQEEKVSHRNASIGSSSRRSSDHFPPPPPQNFETLDVNTNGSVPRRSTSSTSYRSSVHEEVHSPDAKLIRTERFSPDENNSPPNYRNHSSQNGSHFSTLTVEHTHHPPPPPDNSYSAPAAPSSSSSSSLVPNTAISRVDTLLSDQKRLEREIDEQIRRLKYDYDDVRKQIDRKESAIHNEVKHIASRLDDDITEHYHRKQKIYADLAADTNTVGTELERLKSHAPNNKQQLWASLEQIESDIRHIRQAVQQHKELHNALTFAEGRQALAADTIGQITYNKTDSYPRYPPSPIPSHNEQPTTNLTPYKYLKMDHLSALEPEAIAITEDGKKILLGICNKLFILNEYGETLRTIPLIPSIRGIAIAKKPSKYNIAYVSHDEIVSMIDIDSGQTLDCVKETDSSGESGTFLPLGIDTDQTYGNVYVCDYRNSCVIKFDERLEFLTQWRIYNHSDRYDEARPKLISVYGHKLYMIVEHSCKPYYNQGIAYTFSLHICDSNSGNIIQIIDADLLSTQRLRWPCSVQAINHDTCYVLDTMTSGKYFNGQWQKHWSRVLQIGQDEKNLVKELFQLDSEAATMAMTKQTMIVAANGEILFVDLAFIHQHE